ncbi:MAG: BrnA antitoxin family protein [Elusimicrobia bacterium]|nr:BrnA antitoxin family protein [Candidatus Liberimonas magnetica]
MKKLKELPKFKTEKEEADFWDTHDVTDYIDMSQAKRVIFPNLKPSSTAVPVRFPNSLLNSIKMIANRRHVPYQSLIKIFLAERVNRELHKAKA